MKSVNKKSQKNRTAKTPTKKEKNRKTARKGVKKWTLSEVFFWLIARKILRSNWTARTARTCPYHFGGIKSAEVGIREEQGGSQAGSHHRSCRGSNPSSCCEAIILSPSFFTSAPNLMKKSYHVTTSYHIWLFEMRSPSMPKNKKLKHMSNSLAHVATT